MPDMPIEVKLVSEVRQCRTCQWFWGATPPYGNFARFDWKEDYPEAIRNQHQITEEWAPPKPVLRGRAVGQGQIDPGVMHGCRKAPIMTIGINPNMTSYFISDTGARWSYPNFSNDARYAYYYRHHNVYQESLSLDFIKANIKPGSEIIAEKDGWLLDVERSADHRWVLLTIRYVDEESSREIEVAWTDTLRFVVLADTSRQVNPDRLGFRAGDLIGGKIEGLQSDDVQIYENATGYYQRFVFVLDRFKQRVGGPLASADLSISEDVAQHDMVACASPGWSDRYDIPRDRISHNCVMDNAFLISQLVQSRPAVIVIVGGSSMAMFGQALAPFLIGFDYRSELKEPDGTTRTVIKETYQLLKETVEREHFLHIKVRDYELRSRIVVSPHFSYRDNFQQQSRLSAKAWSAFREDFPDDSRVLIEEKRLHENTWNDIVPLEIHGSDDKIRKRLSTASWNVLMSYYYDPIEMLADALQQEWEAARLAYREDINRLQRADGPCHFCVNDLWEFPEGCPYGKTSESVPTAGPLEAVTRVIVQQAQAATSRDR